MHKHNELQRYEGFIRWVLHKYCSFGSSSLLQSYAEDYMQIGRLAAFESMRQEMTEEETLNTIRNAMGRAYQRDLRDYKRRVNTDMQNLFSQTDPHFCCVEFSMDILNLMKDSDTSELETSSGGNYFVDLRSFSNPDLFDLLREYYDGIEITRFTEMLKRGAELSLDSLSDHGLKISDVNHLISLGILQGRIITGNTPIEWARNKRDWLYAHDPVWRESFIAKMRVNWAKALAGHRRLLRDDPEYLAMTIRNLKHASSQAIQRYCTDPEYHSWRESIARKNMVKARATLADKLMLPEFRDRMTQTRRDNIARGREVHQHTYWTDVDYQRRVKKKFQANAARGRAAQAQMFEADPEFKKKKIRVGCENLSKAVQKHKQRLGTDSEYLKLTRQNLALGHVAASQKSLAITAPRRQQLLEQVIKPYFGGLSPFLHIEEIVSFLSREEFLSLRDQYTMRLYGGVRNDIRVLRRGNNVQSVDTSQRRALLHQMIIARYGELHNRLPRREIVGLLQTDIRYASLREMYADLEKGVPNDITFLRRANS